jgi:hypothetical protein
MSARIKRTYNLPADSVAIVKRLVEEDGIAPNQDALVEYAIQNLAREVREAKEAELWAKAAEDKEFLGENDEWDRLLPPADLDAWE